MFNPIAAWTQPNRPVSRVTFAALTVASIALDQLTKWLAALYLRPLRLNPAAPFDTQKIDVIPNFFALFYQENTGAAFSMFSEHTGALALFSAAISVAFIVWAWRIRPEERGMRIAFGLIVGGAVGNLIDRVRLNYVIDFLHAHWRWEYSWPTFNVADSSVCVGMTLLIIASLRLPRERGEEAEQPGAADAEPASHEKNRRPVDRKAA